MRRFTSTIPLLLAGVTASLVLAGFLFQISQPPGHDLAWLLIATERFLTEPGLDTRGFIDPNPPLILYLLMPAVAVSRLVGASAVHCTALYLTLLATLSLVLSNRLLKRLAGNSDAPIPRQIILLFLAFALAIFPGLPITALSFAQREHLMLLLLVPYLVACAGEARSTRPPPFEAAIVGVLGGIGAAVKPHYLLCLVAIEGYLALRRRTFMVAWRPQTLALVAMVLAYLISLPVVTPTYLKVSLPLLLDAYWNYQRPLFELVQRLDVLALLATLPALWLVRRERWALELGGLATLAAGCFYLAMLFQGTGWRYHLLPVQGLVILVLALPIAVTTQRIVGTTRVAVPRPAAALVAASGLAVGLIAVVASPTFPGWAIRGGHAWRAGEAVGLVARYRDEIDARADGRGVYFLSPALGTEFSALAFSGAHYCARFSCLWPLPAIVRARDAGGGAPSRLTPARTDQLDRFVRDAVVEDLRSCRPALVLVDRHRKAKTYGPVAVDLLAYFGRDPRFAELWQDYHPDGRLGRFDVYIHADTRR